MSTATAVPATIAAPPSQPSPNPMALPPGTGLADALAETVRLALKLEAWQEAEALESLLVRVADAVRQSVLEEDRLKDSIRGSVLGRLAAFPDAPASAGVYQVPDRLLRAARRNVLLPGGVTACDGASAGHDGLTASVLSVGICLVRYDGLLNSWRSTFLRHDYDARVADPLNQLRGVLDRRASASETVAEQSLPILLRRGVMATAERKALLEKAGKMWKFGHGVPAPLELLTGSGNAALLDAVLPVLEGLLLQDDHWLFAPSALGNRALLTVANALQPGELAIIQTGKPMLESIIETANFPTGYRTRVETFAAKLGAASVVGGYRATRHSPPRLFVAPAARAVEAGILAMADGGMNPHSGHPLLLDLAGIGARTGLAVDAFSGVVEAAYARARAGHLFAPGRVSSDSR